MSYIKTLEYLFNQLPMFQRVGAAAYKANLNNTIAICKLLGNPENKFKSIHVAGTNGKGSTSHLLASILQEHGFKVGLYTSPHLKDFRERIKINGKMISKKAVVDFVSRNKAEFEIIQPSFFEMTVGLAFEYFADEKVDFAIIETGLGGRLDSTNVITPILSIITNISLDHTNLLGNTVEEIAFEKAGIIKDNIPVVIGETQNEIKSIFIQKAKQTSSEIYFADQNYLSANCNNDKDYFSLDINHKNRIAYSKIECELKGIYQSKNIVTSIQACEILKSTCNLSDTKIKSGIKKVITNTGLLGRWQTLSNNPLTICDTGHNEAGISEVINQINKTKHQHLHVVLGMVNDKEIDKVLKMLPKKATYYFCKANIPRALDAVELMQKGKEIGLVGNHYKSVKYALKEAQNNASNKDLIFIGGSTFVVAEVV